MSKVLRRAFSLLYSGGSQVHRWICSPGKKRLSCPVFCVGNLTFGGTGKTTMVRVLARKLQAKGLRVVVVSRGYRSKHDGSAAVVSDGIEIRMNATQAGDEAFLLAQALKGVPVLIGRKRAESGQLAIEKFNPRVILLDDGFQHWGLHRDLDIVLLDATQPFGFLREPVGGLARAGLVVITHADCVSSAELRTLEGRIHRIAPKATVARARHVVSSLRNFAGDSEVSVESLKGMRVFALSSLGNPGGFERTLVAAGAEVVGSLGFGDHHQYSQEEIDRVQREAAARDAKAVLTTEKDAVKIRKEWVTAPLWVLGVELEFVSGGIEVDEVLESTLARLDLS